MLELPWWWWGFRARGLSSCLLAWFFANCSSYPLVFFVLPGLFANQTAYVAIAETLAPAWELAFCWLAFGRLCKREIPAVILANLTSWLVGVAVWEALKI